MSKLIFVPYKVHWIIVNTVCFLPYIDAILAYHALQHSAGISEKRSECYGCFDSGTAAGRSRHLPWVFFDGERGLRIVSFLYFLVFPGFSGFFTGSNFREPFCLQIRQSLWVKLV
jgi:hypothetical protein